jgi:hypothetical protein
MLVTLAAAAATAALGQTPIAVPSAGSSAAQGTAAIPDFSGIWSHPSFPGFEPPASGPGPVVNKSRRPQANFDGRVLPPSNDVLVSNPALLVGDYGNPILKPQAAEVVKKHGEMELSGAGSPTPTIQCWPEPVPYIFNGVAMEMLQQPDKIAFLYPNDHQVRYVRLNRPHASPVTPSWYGDSVGRYEGDTLVIDTVGVRTDRPYAMLDLFGTPYTDKLHVVERYLLREYDDVKDAIERNKKENWLFNGDVFSKHRGKFLQLHVTIEDEGVFTTPWTATLTYVPGPDQLAEEVCAENTHQYYYSNEADVPRADKPDF